MIKTEYEVPTSAGQQKITVESLSSGSYRVVVGDRPMILHARHVGRREYHLLHEGRSLNVLVDGEAPDLTVHLDGISVPVRLLDERQSARLATVRASGGRAADGTVAITAPMPGQVVKCLVTAGEAVTTGQGVIVVEAMKMENELRSTVDGTVKALKVAEGDNVEAGACLLLIE